VTTPSSNATPVIWRVAGRVFHFQQPPATIPLVMGIVNTTPDSFSDAGQFLAADQAVAHALRLVDEGADIIDIGGQSTRPGSDPVSLDVELARVLPAIAGLRKRSDVLISIDTSKAEVARQAVAAGAQIINDVTALGEDSEMLDVVKSSDVGVIVMHILGTPKTMQDAPAYGDVVTEIRSFLEERVAWLTAQGVARERIVVDPGIGFGKTHSHNLRLVRDLDRFCELGRPICLGASRKGFIGKILNRPIDQRAAGSAAVALAGYLRGATILRVHDVATTRDLIVMTRTIEQGEMPA
jgi:dihydropteroate synthase